MNGSSSKRSLVQRISDLHARRKYLRERQASRSRRLPDWSITALRMAGMSRAELAMLMAEEAGPGGADEGVDEALIAVETELQLLEVQLMAMPARGLDGVAAVLDLALARIRDRARGMFDHEGEDRRLVALLEHAADDLRDIVKGPELMAG